MRILIADDDSTSRSILTAILKKWGYDPLVTEDGAAAWDALQTARRARTRPSRLGHARDDRAGGLPPPEGPTLDPSGPCHSSDRPGEKGDIVQGLEAGANDYISKPFDSEELQARVRVGQRMLELQASLREARDALAHQATHDALTGIFNRRAILDRLSEELSRAKREKGKLSVGMCDIDHFKNINDARGHQAGDEALVAFSPMPSSPAAGT